MGVCGEVDARDCDLLLYILGLELRSSHARELQATTTTQRYGIEFCDVDQGDLAVKRSRCGAGLGISWTVVFSMWITLATSLLEAGSYGSVDTENGSRAK